jgi:hypothetical protein
MGLFDKFKAVLRSSTPDPPDAPRLNGQSVNTLVASLKALPVGERVARALCQADGQDPNARVPTGRMVITGDAGLEFYLLWTDYEKEARRFIAALDAAQPV